MSLAAIFRTGILALVIGFGAITMVLTNPEFADVAKGVIKGGAGTANMAAVLVAKSVGGDILDRKSTRLNSSH